MKKFGIFFICLALMLSLLVGLNLNTAYALEEGVELKINGRASVEVSPDLAEVYGVIKACSFDGEDAKENANETYSYLENVIRNESSCTLTKEYDYIQPYARDYGYSNDVSVYCFNISIKFEDLSRLKPVLDILGNIENLDLNDINYMVEDNSSYYADALKLAIQNAVEKAEMVNSNEVELLRVEETNNYWCGASKYERLGENINLDNVKISIYANVNAEFITK